MRWHAFIRENGLYIAWSVALIATMGSLYFSEVLGYLPCKLCWYQRILMYPLSIILGIAAVKKDVKQCYYVLPLSLWGAGISTYHYLIEKTSLFKNEASASCGIIPCDFEYINWFGFITIPFLALTAFTLISILMILIIKSNRQ